MSTLLDNIETFRESSVIIEDFRALLQFRNGGVNAGHL